MFQWQANPVNPANPSNPSGTRAVRIFLLLGTLCLGSFVLAALCGSVLISANEWRAALRYWFDMSGAVSDMSTTLLSLRLTRAGLAFVIGASLALAGVMMQALLRNPLADPYILGISGGAAVGALGMMLVTSVVWLIDSAAFLGAAGVSLVLYVLARRDLQSGVTGGSSSLLLTGVILSSGCMALVTLMLALAPEGRLRGMVFWMIGDLGGSEWRVFPCLILGLALLYAVRVARSVNVLALHAENAVTLGVPVAALRQGLFACAAVLTATAVSNGGSIGFVGLIVPHACRFAFGPDHRILMPAAALAGGSFLVITDTLARSVAAPLQLPVGVVTALIGVPIFLIQLHQVGRIKKN